MAVSYVRRAVRCVVAVSGLHCAVLLGVQFSGVFGFGASRHTQPTVLVYFTDVSEARDLLGIVTAQNRALQRGALHKSSST